MAKKTDQEIIFEGIVKQFPRDSLDHKQRMQSTRLYKTYHKALAHAKTLSDNDLAARVKRHGDEAHTAQHLDTRAHFFDSAGRLKDEAAYDKHLRNMEELHYTAQAYAYEHRTRRGEKHPAFDSYTPEYIDQQTKDRY